MPKPYNPQDKLMRKAKHEGYRARSVYKLQELDKKFKLLKPGMLVLDLAAAPGSWLQYTSEKIGNTGKAIGIDLKPITEVAPNVITMTGDLTNIAAIQSILDNKDLEFDKFDLVLSDIAPNTSGIKHADHIRSIELNRAIVQIALKYLKPEGKLVMKVFPGVEFQNFKSELKKYFKVVEEAKVKATRDRSSEIYLICKERRNYAT